MQNNRPEHLIILLLLNAIFFVAGAFIYLLAFNFDISLVEMAFAHLVIVATCFGVVLLYKCFNFNYRIPLFCTVTIAFLGSLGALSNIFAIILYAFLKKDSDDEEGFCSSLIPEEEYVLSQDVYERVLYGMDSFNPVKIPIAFLDVLIYGTVKQKRIAIDRILRHFRPSFSKALQQALNDESNSIRVLAATAVTRIDDIYTRRYYELKQMISENDAEKGLYLLLGRHCDDYASLAFIDEDTKEKMLKNAFEAYQVYIEAYPDELTPQIDVSRLLYHMGRYRESVESMQNIIERDEILPDNAYKWYFSSLFKLKEYDKMRALARKETLRVGGYSVEYDDVVELLLLWKRGVDVHLPNVGVVHG